LRVSWAAKRRNQSILKNHPEIPIGRIATEVYALIICPPYVKRQLIGKDPDAGKD